MGQIEDVLRDTQEQLNNAELMANEQASKHKELTALAAKSDDLLDTIRVQSEDVNLNVLSSCRHI